ncbi:MAG: hypothetical protein MZU95_03235 [Desulfomicrobium escambiense]|nr:hypothetical protein [Desulfomicrobium escambiense]
MMYWRNREKTRETMVQGELDRQRRQVRATTPTAATCYCGRSDDMLKVSGIYVSPVRGRGDAGAAPGGARGAP